MLAQSIIDNIIDVFYWHSTWIAVKSFGDVEVFAKDCDGDLMKFPCIVLKLEVRINNGDFEKGKTLSIPEFKIEEAIEQLSHDKEFRSRLESGTLESDDVNAIIYNSSWGSIEPELSA